jgi:hypothetical protein
LQTLFGLFSNTCKKNTPISLAHVCYFFGQEIINVPNEHPTKSPYANAENHTTQTHQPAYSESEQEQITRTIAVLQGKIGADSLAFQSWQDRSPETQPLDGKDLGQPEMQLRFPKLGEIADLAGTLWDVSEIRPTKHGFDIYYGTPTSHPGGDLRVRPHPIATIGLMEFWHDNSTRSHGFLFDLPVGCSTLKNMRARLGFNFHEDLHAFWEDRIDDLRSLSRKKFAARHGVSPELASHRRRKMVGNTARVPGWWRKREVIAILLSSQSLVGIGRKLGISVGYVSRLRQRARQEAQQSRVPVSTNLILFPASETSIEGDYQPPIAA